MFDTTAMRSMCEPHDAITCNMVEPVSFVWSCPVIQHHRASSSDSIDLSICTHTYHACNNYTINTYAYACINYTSHMLYTLYIWKWCTRLILKEQIFVLGSAYISFVLLYEHDVHLRKLWIMRIIIIYQIIKVIQNYITPPTAAYMQAALTDHRPIYRDCVYSSC